MVGSSKAKVVEHMGMQEVHTAAEGKSIEDKSIKDRLEQWLFVDIILVRNKFLVGRHTLDMGR